MLNQRNICLAVLILNVQLSLNGQDGDQWRVWAVGDGMLESYVRYGSRGINGEIWVRHGIVGKLSVLDGWGVKQVQEPQLSMDQWLNWQTKVWPNGRGAAYSTLGGTVIRFQAERTPNWQVVRKANRGERLIDALPRADGSVLGIFSDHLELYQPESGKWSTVQVAAKGRIGAYRDATSGFNGEVWIAASEGIGRYSEKGIWEERSSKDQLVKNLDHPMPGKAGELLASGDLGGRRATLAWRAGGLEVVARNLGAEAFGWQGPDDTVWLLDSRKLFRILGGIKVEIPRRGRLSSDIFGIIPEPDGGFYVETVDGLLQLRPGLWHTPAEVAEVHELVHDIIEDRQGRIWFAATDWLVEFDGKRWKKHRLPDGMPTHNLMSRALMQLPDGRLLVKSAPGPGRDLVLVFDPANGRFEELKRPQGLDVRFFLGLKNGKALTRSLPGFRLEEFDGKNFELLADLSKEWKGGALKDVLEMGHGRFWLAGAGGGGILDGNKYQELVPTDYPDDSGFFSLTGGRDGSVLVGGRRSLMRWQEGQLRHIRSGLDRIRSLLLDRKGAIWMATAAGVLRLENGNWIGNDAADGLPSGLAHKVFEDSQGRIWAGTAQGLSLYRGGRDRDSPRTLLSRAGKPNLGSSGGSVVIGLAGLDYWKQTNQTQLLHSWRLDGGNWSGFAQVSEARFEGLPGGRHHLEVRSMDRNGNVERTPDEIWFEVPLPWYREAGFLGLTTMMCLALGVLVVFAFRSYRERGRMVEELSKARQDAEAASRQKSLFLANMSHEIRTPMNAILGMNQLALETPAGAEQREYLRLAHQSAGELLTLLNDILDLSKVEAGKMELHEEHFNLRQCVEGVARTLELRAREKGLQLSVRFGEGIPEYVVGDAHRIRQVLFNLMGNALKFTEVGEVSIQLRQEQELLHWVVCDTGMGIPAEQQRRIFEPFVQADGTATRKHSGTGLGLAISAELVRMMGGRIWVESPWRMPGEGPMVSGSAFHFTLPMVVGQRPAEPAAELQQTETARPLRVLVAEDNLINQKLIHKLLQRDGHEVRLVSNGIEALEAIRQQSVDLVLMDVQMPGMDGLEATRRIRQKELLEGGHLRVVAITANALDGDRERCLEAGMDGYLTKPIQLPELRAILKYTVKNVDCNRNTGN